MIIYFNLWLLVQGHLRLISTFETLEQCQAYQHQIEETNPGDYYCRWVQVENI